MDLELGMGKCLRCVYSTEANFTAVAMTVTVLCVNSITRVPHVSFLV